MLTSAKLEWIDSLNLFGANFLDDLARSLLILDFRYWIALVYIRHTR